MKRKFRAFYKPDFDTPDGAIKFIQKQINNQLWFVAEDDKEIRYPFEIPFMDSDWIIQEWTRFKDKNKVEIYEGDIIKFHYQSGDFAYSDMSPEEQETELNIRGEYIGTIVPKMLEPSNLEIMVGDMHMFFPLSYAGRSSEVIGNIYQR